MRKDTKVEIFKRMSLPMLTYSRESWIPSDSQKIKLRSMKKDIFKTKGEIKGGLDKE